MRQTEIAVDALRAIRPDVSFEVVPIQTKGDADKKTPFERLGPKGVFAHELQRALLEDRLDVAVHSLKDLQSAEPEGLVLAAVLEREDARDVLVSRSGRRLGELDAGSVVGTSSARREALVLIARPDVRTAPLRGNVDTRLGKVAAGDVDAAVLAAAGVSRLGRTGEVTEWLDPEVFVPPPGQGALALEATAARFGADLAWVAGAQHAPTRACVDAERAFMREIEGSCEVPLGAWARYSGSEIVCDAFVSSRGGGDHIRDSEKGRDPEAVGSGLGRRMLEAGARALVARA